MSEQVDKRLMERVAGISALFAGFCWIVWIAANSFAGELSISQAPRLTKLTQLAIAGWNLLLIPSAIAIYGRLRIQDRDLGLLLTVAGVVSLLFWAYGGASGTITPGLEVVYLILSGLWWSGIGYLMLKSHRYFGSFTLIVGIFALLDAVLSFFEPLPFYIYVLAAPKLPLSIIWDFWIGFYFLSRENHV